jgi:hypothetical protein
MDRVDNSRPWSPYLSFPPKSGLGGILIIVGIWLVANPIATAYRLLAYSFPMFHDGRWSQIVSQGTRLTPPSLSVIVAFETASNIALLALAIAALVRFFRMSESFPRTVIGLVLAQIAYVYIDSKLLQFAPPQSVDFLVNMQRELDHAVLGGLLWVPYFLLSSRVKNTFIK